MDLVGCYGVYTNILKWMNNPDDKHSVLIGPTGCGKSSLINHLKSSLVSKINFIDFNCSSRLNKKIVVETIEKQSTNSNIIDMMMGDEKKLVCIFDEIDGTIECENISYLEISKYLSSNNILGIFISSNKGLSKLNEVIKTNHLFKLGPYNHKDLLRFFVSKYNDIDINETKNIISECNDDVRKMKECIEYKTNNEKDITNDLQDSKSILNLIIKSDIEDGMRLIETDIMNVLFTVHENYHILTKDYCKVLKCLSQVDMFQQNMFENQLWGLNSFSQSSLYESTRYLKPSPKPLKSGTMWSKCSNWQYKKKLYNNFAFTKSNCVFHNAEFVYSLKTHLLNCLMNDDMDSVVSILNRLDMNKENFEQLLRVTDIDGRKSEFKGSLKNKLMKSLK